MAREKRPETSGEERTARSPATVRGGADLTRPLLPQVRELGAGYWAWVHESITPVQAQAVRAERIESGDGLARRWPQSLRMFENSFLETLSHIPWWTIPLIWFPVVVLLFVAAILGGRVAPARAALWAVGGMLLWTLAEYVLHRFAFHYRPKSAAGRRLHFMAHGIHHLDPWDPTRLVFPPPVGILMAGGIFALLRLVLPLGPALALMSGFLAGYIVYDLTHYYTHHARPRSRWGRFLRSHHMAHHHRYQHEMYGVSQPLWDIVFRSDRPVS